MIPKETMHYRNTFFTIIFFYFLCAMNYLSLTLHKKFKTFQKNLSIPRMDEKKLHTQKFQWRGIGRNMSTTECSKHLWHIATEKDISSELKSCVRYFYQIFIFHHMIALQKLWKMFFISSEKLFLFSRYSKYLDIFPSFSPYQPLL